MNRKKIIVTGANGFIGAELSNFFSKKDFDVIALHRKITIAKQENIHYKRFDLYNVTADESWNNADALIHCAYIKNNIETNISAAQQIKLLAKKYAVKKIIFLSSLSANEHSKSKYGKQKYAIEQIFSATDNCIIRPGLVIGNGGLYMEMLNHVKANRLIPFVSNGLQPVQSIAINELCLAINNLIEHNLCGIYTVAHKPVPYKLFYQNLASAVNTKAQFVKVPFWLLFVLIKTLNLFDNKKITLDSLYGLKEMSQHDTDSDMKKLGILE